VANLLDPNKIAALLNKQARTAPASHKQYDWLVTLENKRLILDAMRARSKAVLLMNPITRRKMKFNIFYETCSHVFVRPSYPFRFAPCGWFTEDWLSKSIVEDEVVENDDIANV
jgi:hypothetical protein